VIIDTHCHFIPSHYIEEARQGRGIDGIRLEDQGDVERIVHPELGMQYPLKPEFHRQDAKLEAMDGLGIDVSVLSIVPLWLMHWTPADVAIAFCRRANDDLAEMIAGCDRLIGLATVPMQAPDEAAAELRRTVTELDFRGVQIGTTIGGTPLDDERFEPFFKAAEELDVPVMIHPAYAGRPSPFTEYYLKNLIGNPLATVIASSRLIFSGFLDRHPRLKLVLVHAGGFMPYQIGRLDHGYNVRAEARKRIGQLPSSYLRRFYYDTISHATAPLRFLADLVGSDRVVFGTDIPFDMADVSFADIIPATGLGARAIEAIYSKNAEQLFRIGEAVGTGNATRSLRFGEAGEGNRERAE